MSTETGNTGNSLVPQNFNIADLLKLDRFFAPKILLVLYWISMVGVALSAILTVLGSLATMFTVSFAFGFLQFIFGLLLLALGPLYIRLLFEMMTVFFSINESLQGIRENTRR